MENNIQKFLESVAVIDVESTSDQPQLCDVIELAVGDFKEGDWVTVIKEQFKPSIPIPAASAEKHFISDEMVVNCNSFDTSYDCLADKAVDVKYFVAHNAQYDRTAIVSNYTRLDIEVTPMISTTSRWICTFELAKVIFNNEYMLPAYRLGFLWFYFKLYDGCKRVIIPHQADSDIYMAGKLLEFLVQCSIELKLVDATGDIGEQLVRLIEVGIAPTHWPYGSHKGKLLSEIPKDYFKWALNNMDMLKVGSSSYSKSLHDAVLQTIKT